MAPKSIFFALAAVNGALAYPWVPQMPGVDSSMIGARAQELNARDAPNCPFNPNHEPAAPITDQFPYMGAKNGIPGSTKGGIQVPAPGDTAHAFRAPNPKTDIRGPCPGLNVLANHGFLARDGITTYNELVDAQQNVYNTGPFLANLLAIAGVGLTGDIVGTTKMSLGCDATSRTASSLNLLASEGGLNSHNKFEADTSLTRNDFFLADGDNYHFNTTLFTQMMSVCNGNCGREELALYRLQRYEASKADNGNFFFGPGSLLLFGAASFLYELMPGSSHKPDEATMMSFFGASKDASGNYVNNGQERLPENWYNRVEHYSNVSEEILAMYALHPVPFGGNVGKGNFNGLNSGTDIVNGKINPDLPYNALCLMYQALTGAQPGLLGVAVNLPVNSLSAITKGLAPMAANLGCPTNHNDGSQSTGANSS
ncbi:unnamed protein product [Zymoseptoria tritici ST99CH_1E4]|uniref:Heme haloperoxidase family profile domain-containing protein n=2 Tax=Zymoseptoria tritici TaxID=1047171 RepID=F9XP91_ZYMTI|nr:uncharacterized protein MYCGRDRAFT_50742 [Zymoseptoria tritici IPO323]EGP83009.1 hypothetical protein MYCGRDRAFT_50742 [Zymoseptoria tritici IPO323]SMR61134.1 unnamed protein product [Zymoseptoria tritici ST99CH_1E4]